MELQGAADDPVSNQLDVRIRESMPLRQGDRLQTAHDRKEPTVIGIAGNNERLISADEVRATVYPNAAALLRRSMTGSAGTLQERINLGPCEDGRRSVRLITFLDFRVGGGAGAFLFFSNARMGNPGEGAEQTAKDQHGQ